MKTKVAILILSAFLIVEKGYIDLAGWVVAMRGIKKGCRSILLRSHPDSNWSKRFCRPVPNHSAMEPCCECKGSTFVLNYQTLSEIFAKSGKNEAKVR